MKRLFLFLLLTSYFSLLTFLKLQAQIAASCTPQTTSYCCGFGILNLTFNTINKSSVNASEGYKNFTSVSSTTVSEGKKYKMSVDVSGGQASQNVRAYLDYNNNGVLDSLAELVFSVNSCTSIATRTITIPSGVTLNTALRLRVIAEYDLLNPPGPCKNQQYGQAEDHKITITANASAPDVAFHADNTTTCSGKVIFFDDSQNLPASWLWFFGDGGSSTKQNPTHTYTSNGNYKVKLKATNSNGNDIDSIINYINVTLGAGPVATCNVSTLSYCCNHGITNVSLKTINNPTADGVDGYKDYSCTQQTALTRGMTYSVSVGTGTSNAHDVKIWIDFNNDGTLNNTNELVFSSFNQNSPKGSIFIPTSANVYLSPLRMRVMADQVGNTLTPCTDVNWGQTEDYTIKVIDPTASVESIDDTENLSVYPNPASTKIFVILSSSEELAGKADGVKNLFLYNVLGEEIYAWKFTSNKHEIDISALPKGIYFLKIITSEREQLTRKIILE